MRKHKLKREYRALPASLEGVTLVVARSIHMGGGVLLLPGTDVTEEAKGWRNIRMLLLRGYLVANPPVNAPRVVPVTHTPPAAFDTVTPTGRHIGLADLSADNSKREIREALEAAGVEVSGALSKSDLLVEVARVLEEMGE